MLHNASYVLLGCLLVAGVVYILTIIGGGDHHNPSPPKLQNQDKYRPDREYPVPAPYPQPTGLATHGASGALGTSMAPSGMDRQYSNGSVNVRDVHPVLAYQMLHDKAINPANIGDPIRIPDVAGPTGLYGGVTSFVDSLSVSRGSIPVPMGALKRTSEKYNKDQFRFSPLAVGTIGSAVSGSSVGSSVGSLEPYQDIYGGDAGMPFPGSLSPPGSGMPYTNKPVVGDFFRPYGPNTPVSNVPFFGNVNAYAPFPEIVTAWEKAGILTSTVAGKDSILNLYRRPIAPLQDLWEYQVQDKDGFVIKLEGTKYIENGDIIPHIIGKNGLGPWKAHVFVQNKYVWVS